MAIQIVKDKILSDVLAEMAQGEVIIVRKTIERVCSPPQWNVKSSATALG